MENIDFYEIAKILHIISIISWFAGLLYLPRLFVYHCQVEFGSKTHEIFTVMEYKLLRYIMNPAMITSIVFGLYLAYIYGFALVWLHIKITLVIILVIYHHFLGRCRKNFAAGTNKRSEKFYRIINEIPALLLIFIITLVILKPF